MCLVCYFWLIAGKPLKCGCSFILPFTITSQARFWSITVMWTSLMVFNRGSLSFPKQETKWVHFGENSQAIKARPLSLALPGKILVSCNVRCLEPDPHTNTSILWLKSKYWAAKLDHLGNLRFFSGLLNRPRLLKMDSLSSAHSKLS